eukprot:scaffold8115_cov113-Skeletonema_dohrnii-CCMP3373.AAC.1
MATQAAAAYAVKQQVNSGPPQVGSPNGGDEQQEAKPAGWREWILRVGAVGNLGVQGVNVALQIPRMALVSATDIPRRVGGYTVYASSGLGAVHSPAVMVKERQLTKEDTFRTALNGIREEQGRLTQENDILSAEIDDLQSEVDRMKDIEMALRELSETQGSQLSQLMDLIRQNKEINDGMRAVLKSKAAEENKEIDRLIIGMKLMDGVSFDENMFRDDLAKCGGSVDEVIAMIKDMFDSGEAGEGEERCTGGRCTINIDEPENFFKKNRGSMTYD